MYINYEVPWHPLLQVYDYSNTHGSAKPQGEDYDANGIFALPLYVFLNFLTNIGSQLNKAVYINYRFP